MKRGCARSDTVCRISTCGKVVARRRTEVRRGTLERAPQLRLWAGRKFEREQAGGPVQLTSRTHVFAGIPHRTIVGGIHTHTGVIAPTAPNGLRAGPGED